MIVPPVLGKLRGYSAAFCSQADAAEEVPVEREQYGWLFLRGLIEPGSLIEAARWPAYWSGSFTLIAPPSSPSFPPSRG